MTGNATLLLHHVDEAVTVTIKQYGMQYLHVAGFFPFTPKLLPRA